jgi:hypothetical protein
MAKEHEMATSVVDQAKEDQTHSSMMAWGATASRQRFLPHSAGLLFETRMAVAILSSQGKRII